MNKTCLKCGEIFPTRITIDKKRYDLSGRKNCLSCVPFKSRNGRGILYSGWTDERKRRHRALASLKGKERKKLLVEYKGNCCSVCGYNKSIRALQFHHRNPDEKSFELSSNEIKSKNWELVLKEADKCDLVCANCHCEIHDKYSSIYTDFEFKNKVVKQNGFPCKKCGIDRVHKSINNLCKKCASENQRKVERPDSITLANQIQENGFEKTGRIYGVSGNAIRKWQNE
jgi:hypothetical protein